MPRTLIGVKEVASILHVSVREIVRMTEKGILPGMKVRGNWQFRAGDVWNWIEDNLESLPDHREKDRHPSTPTGLLVAPAMKECAVALDCPAKTKSSVLRTLAGLAENADPTVDKSTLTAALLEREAQGSTALEHGVAVPHPAKPFYAEGPILAAARTAQGIAFGERQGGLTDLFFLVCCPDHVGHLLHLSRLCRLLIDSNLRKALRVTQHGGDFLAILRAAEEELGRSKE